MFCTPNPRVYVREKGYLDESNERWSARDLQETTSSQSISKKDRGIHGVSGATSLELAHSALRNHELKMNHYFKIPFLCGQGETHKLIRVRVHVGLRPFYTAIYKITKIVRAL